MVSLTSINPNTFALVHDRLQRSFKNQAFKEKPYVQSDRKLRELLLNLAFPIEAQLGELSALKVEDMQGVSSSMLDNCHVDCLLEGNLSALEAAAVVDVVSPVCFDSDLWISTSPCRDS